MEFEGRDLLLEYESQDSSGERWPSSQLVASCRGFPTKYLRLHYNQQQVLQEQRERRVSRAEILKEISLESYRVFRSGGEHAILTTLERRPAPWYDHAVVPFLLSLAGVPSTIPYFLTGPGWLTDAAFDSQDLLEFPICINLGKFRPKSCRKPPPSHILDTVKAFVAYERKAARAVVEQDGRQMQNALEIHPWIDKPELAAALTAQITAQPQVGPN